MSSGNSWWSALTTGGGILASFGAAACCALPLALVSAGIGTAWLGGISPIVAPYREPLLIVAALLLLVGAVQVTRQFRRARSCPADAACASPTYRYATLAGLVIGLGLLVGAFFYG
ncbi:mercuric transporter MerT family protein [Sphingomicrobium lutaoense]|uniref:Mercuric transport protein MerT n=1 Tax=Sphingomicrobium lutaoense TaxID=515949 RepID=A0A839Z0F9_9SPHN|nr:mercuric transporter MerT family protein [Sphingomicrobium lutaoense]MBB3763537.1 mercuric ion transport protein [Sphingomicrobium lutaoense]